MDELHEESSVSARDARPRIALTLGDPAGIGPEIALRTAAEPEVRRAARLLLLGPAALRPPELPRIASASEPWEHAYLATSSTRGWVLGRAQAEAGAAALAALRCGAELAMAGAIDALVTAPVSKEALHLAGEPVEGQTELLERWASPCRVQMLAVARRLRVALLSRHVPLRAALESIEPERVLDHLRRLHVGLRGLGFEAPHMALAGLNPHAGESGILGREEIEFLQPAVERARVEGLHVSGPEPPDTVFLRAAQGAFDAVLALYHDQAFIPTKLLAPDEGLTVLLGLPYLRVSPAHGTAFDIAGRGVARHANLVRAVLQAATWALRYAPERSRA